jgi:hypothetical protein
MERERRAFSRAAAGTDPEPFSDPSQDVDVRELLAALPDRLREPFLLHYYAGFGIREIAARLKKPEGTIKADLYHARARLKEALAERMTGPFPIQRQGDAASARRKTARTPGDTSAAPGDASAMPQDASATYVNVTGAAGDAAEKKGRGARRGLRRTNAG